MKKNNRRCYREIINYIIVGGFTTFISILLFFGSVWTFLDGNNALQLQLANVISWAGAVLFAYSANRKYVFKSTSENIIEEMFTFILLRVVMLLLDMGIMYFFTSVLSVDYNIAKLISVVGVMVGNYVFSKMFVFNK